MSNFFPDQAIIVEAFKSLKKGVLLVEDRTAELEEISEILETSRERLDTVSSRENTITKERDYLEKTLENLNYFIELFDSNTPFSQFKERYFDAKENFGSIQNIKNEIKSKNKELARAKVKYQNKTKKLFENKNEIKRLKKLLRNMDDMRLSEEKRGEALIKILKEFPSDNPMRSQTLIESIEKAKEEIERLKKDNIKIEEKLNDKKNNIKQLKKEAKALEDFSELRLWKNYLVRLIREQGKNIDEISDDEFNELVKDFQIRHNKLKRTERNLGKERDQINSDIESYTKKRKKLKRFLSTETETTRYRKDSINFIRDQLIKMEQIYRNRRMALGLANIAFQHLEKKGYKILATAEKTIGGDIGVLVAVYNTRSKKLEEVIVKLNQIEDYMDKKIKISENIDFEILGKETSIEQELSITDDGEWCVTSSKIISDNCENLTDFYNTPANRKLFVTNKSLNTSMFDILTGAIAINAKDVRGDNIAIDISDPKNLKAYNIDIQSIDYWRDNVEDGEFPYDLDKISQSKVLNKHKNDFNIMLFSNKKNLTKTVSELFFEGETWKHSNGATVYGERGGKPLFDAFQLIASQPGADEKLKQSFERMAKSLMKKYDEYKSSCEEYRRSRNFGEEYERAQTAFNKTKEALGRYAKLDWIIKKNCGKEIFNISLLREIKSRSAERTR